MNIVYLFLLSPLHTGGTTQEGNLLGIARESHTNLPYIPSSTIRGRLRASLTNREQKFWLFGNEIGQDGEQLYQGAIWIGDGSLLWVPVPSLSHGVVWITCPLLVKRWLRVTGQDLEVPVEYSTNLPENRPIYLKDAILKDGLRSWQDYQNYIPVPDAGVNSVIVLPDQHCATLIQMSLWRQVKVKLSEHKVVEGGFRYEEAIPPDTLMYFPWGVTAQASEDGEEAQQEFERLLSQQDILQIGGQESLGRGFVQVFNGAVK